MTLNSFYCEHADLLYSVLIWSGLYHYFIKKVLVVTHEIDFKGPLMEGFVTWVCELKWDSTQ